VKEAKSQRILWRRKGVKGVAGNSPGKEKKKRKKKREKGKHTFKKKIFRGGGGNLRGSRIIRIKKGGRPALFFCLFPEKKQLFPGEAEKRGKDGQLIPKPPHCGGKTNNSYLRPKKRRGSQLRLLGKNLGRVLGPMQRRSKKKEKKRKREMAKPRMYRMDLGCRQSGRGKRGGGGKPFANQQRCQEKNPGLMRKKRV